MRCSLPDWVSVVKAELSLLLATAYKMYRFMLDETNDEYDIYINLISSSVGHYLSRRPYVIVLVKELLTTKTLHGERIVIEQDMVVE